MKKYVVKRKAVTRKNNVVLDQLIRWVARGKSHARWVIVNLGWCVLQVVIAKYLQNIL